MVLRANVRCCQPSDKRPTQVIVFLRQDEGGRDRIEALFRNFQTSKRRLSLCPDRASCAQSGAQKQCCEQSGTSSRICT
jgi:hypothetical protein